MTLAIDVETRSELDLTRVGAEKYARHPSTKILCASFSVDDSDVMQWRTWSKQEMPITLTKALYSNDIIQGWNCSFERQIFKHVLKLDIPPERFRCTMARARSTALPGRLEMCARALNMPIQKADSRIMMKWCRPLPGGGWADSQEEYEELCAYCDVDVKTEMEIGKVLRHLSDEEQRDWCVNEYVNQKGIPIDLALVRAAQHYASDELVEIKARLEKLTCGAVTSPRQFARLKEWLPVELEIDSLDATARAALLDDDSIQDDVREVIQLVDDGGRASTAKFAAMEARADEQDRVHGAYIFSGAGQTGRASSTGCQLHNYPRKKLDNAEDVVDAILRRAPKDELIKLSGHNVLTTLSRLLRPSIVAANGHQFVWGDWSAIEARVCPWLSLENSANESLSRFARGEDEYKYQAAMMFGVAEEAVTKDQRQSGKVARLSLQFAGGGNAFIAMAKNYDLVVDFDTAEMYKRTWRQANPWAQRFWNALETAVFNAVRRPGEVFTAGRVAYLCAQSVLWCRLPCDRMIAYPFPRIETVPGKFGPQESVTCIKGSWAPKKGSNHWPRMSLYSGVLCENVTQATAASLLRWALREMADSGWLECMVGHTHDEVLLEVPDEEVEEASTVLEDVMVTGPAWAAGLPLAAEIASSAVYGK